MDNQVLHHLLKAAPHLSPEQQTAIRWFLEKTQEIQQLLGKKTADPQTLQHFLEDCLKSERYEIALLVAYKLELSLDSTAFEPE